MSQQDEAAFFVRSFGCALFIFKENTMKKKKNIALWVLTVFFALSALVYFPSFFSVLAILFVCLVIPIAAWQNILVKHINSKLKVVIAIAIALLAIITVPTTSPDNSTQLSAPPTTESTTAPDPNSATTPATTPITEPTTAPPTAPITEPATVPATTPPTQPATTPVPEPTTTPPHIHNFSAATCTTPKTCSCGATEGVVSEHSWKDATYTSPKTCTVCGLTEGNPQDVPGKENYHGHVYAGGDSGTKYHYEAGCAGEYSHEITWEEVESLKLGPCGKCVLN